MAPRSSLRSILVCSMEGLGLLWSSSPGRRQPGQTTLSPVKRRHPEDGEVTGGTLSRPQVGRMWPVQQGLWPRSLGLWQPPSTSSLQLPNLPIIQSPGQRPTQSQRICGKWRVKLPPRLLTVCPASWLSFLLRILQVLVDPSHPRGTGSNPTPG